MFKKIIKKNERLLVVIICVFYSLFLLWPTIDTLFHIPEKSVNMMVGHYFEDYYEYLSFVRQGYEGDFFLQNFFANTDREPFFVAWWPYPVIGHIGRIIGVEFLPFLYWSASLVLLSIYLIIVYFAVEKLMKKESYCKKLSAFLLIILASGFFSVSFKEGLKIIPWGFWYSISTPFSRLAVGTPHHQTANIVLLIALLFAGSRKNLRLSFKRISLFVLLSLVLFICSPTHLILFWAVYALSVILYIFIVYMKDKYNKGLLGKVSLVRHFKSKALSSGFRALIIPFIAALSIGVPFAFVIRKFFMSSPTLESVKVWDLMHYYRPSGKLFLYASGSLIFLSPITLIYYLRRISFLRLVFFSTAIASFALAILSIGDFPDKLYRIFGFHNLRFLTPSAYIILGVALVELTFRLIKKKIIAYILVLALLIINVIPLYVIWKDSFSGPYKASYLHSMPQDMYQGLKMLESDGNEGVVLTSVNSTLGVAVPAIANKRVYLGRSIFTFDLDKRQKKVNSVYNLQMTPEEAEGFIREENIKYVAVTHFDLPAGKLKDKYPFLDIYVDNEHLTIFRVK